MSENYYNTTHQKGETLQEAIRNAKYQDDKVLAFFKFHPNKSFTPFDVHYNVFEENTPLTSTRRSITNLTKSGKLEMTSEQREGAYGKANYTWRLSVSKTELQTKLFI